MHTAQKIQLLVHYYLTLMLERNSTQQILILRLLAEKVKRKGKKVYNCFIDFQKALDAVKYSITWATMKSYGVGRRLTQMLRVIGENEQFAVRVGLTIINRNTTRRPIITHFFHNISGEGDGWTTGQWHWRLHTWIPTEQPKICR